MDIPREPAGDREAFDEIVARLQAGDPETLANVRDELAKLSIAGAKPKTFPDGWYVIRVELLSGRGHDFDPPPGRDILISPQHTFRQLAEAINAGFARWDLGHLYRFRLAKGTEIGLPDYDDPEADIRDAARSKLGRRHEDETFEYEFDFGDGWRHRCTVKRAGLDPADEYGVKPKGPVAVWGWGSIPDQYGRRTPDGGDESEEDD